ncbi:hypothetical protein OOK27_05630 [Streptomyces canus]|uniref:Hint domain-containing protein n=1 Tax=Streptomyces canus TaxID=58343 RepID=UPI00224FBB45|nr:Hint domain-containing protein [Streptomyces canus]MCX5253655.1 hypothetical protein [Streptomyces canus]
MANGPQRYPGASTAYWYGSKYPGSAMEVNVLCWHSTEGTSLPSYDGGSMAPNLTAKPDFAAKRLVWYQHFDVDMSSRALRNLSGGVETNTLNVCQVEIVGTCDPATHTKWAQAGIQHLYMPELPDWAIRDLADFAKWANANHGVPLSSGLTFKPYPPSYGANGVRMTGTQWNNFTGHCGHQHVPENCVHPDTPILCADLMWRRAGDLKVGDEIVSFDEETVKIGNANGGRRYKRGVVTRNEADQKDSYRVTTTEGEVVASADHPWLVRLPYVNRGSRIAWVPSKDLDPLKHRIISVGRPWDPEDSRIAGWLAGVLDADGHAFAGGRHGSWVGFGQVDGAVLDLFLAECDRRDWPTKVVRRDHTKRSSIAKNPKDFTDIRINGGMWASCRVLGTLLPERLLPAAAQMWEGAAVGKTTGDTAVIRIEHIGVQPIASLSTDARTYIADGLLCHNTHGDPGAFPMAAILAAAKNGTTQEDDVALTDADIAKIAAASAKATLTLDGVIKSDTDSPDNPYVSLGTVTRNAAVVVRRVEKKVDALPAVELTDVQIATLASAVASNSALAEQIAEKVAVKLAERLAD